MTKKKSPVDPGELLAVLLAGMHSRLVIAELAWLNVAAPPMVASQTAWVVQPFMATFVDVSSGV